MDFTMDEDKALEEKGPENMDLDGKKMEDPPASQTFEKQPDASVASSGQHKSKATTVVLTKQEDLAAAGTQEVSMGTAEVPHHVDKEDIGSNSLRKSDVVKPVVLLTQTGMTLDGSAQWKASMLQSKIDSGTLKGQTQCQRLPHEWGLGKGITEAKSYPRRNSAERRLRTQDLMTLAL
jgi:hypothetical protein